MPLISGFQKLFSSLSTGMLVIVPIVGALMVLYHAVGKMTADGEGGIIAEKNKKIKHVFIGVAIGESAAALVKWAAAFFQ